MHVEKLMMNEHVMSFCLSAIPCCIQQSHQHLSPGACLWRPSVLHQPVGLATSTTSTNLVLGTLQRPWRDKAGWTNFCRLTGRTYLVLGSLLRPWQDKAGWTTWCRSTWSTWDIVLGALQSPWQDKVGCKNYCLPHGIFNIMKQITSQNLCVTGWCYASFVC